MPSSAWKKKSEEHTSELQSLTNLVCRLLLEKKKGEAGLDRAIMGVVVKQDKFQFGSDAEICQNAEDAGLCDWLDFAYGPVFFLSYRQTTDFSPFTSLITFQR